ncbi:MAG: hypothetical protein ACXWP6_07395, partial [Ktedonobacterales bacterium]
SSHASTNWTVPFSVSSTSFVRSSGCGELSTEPSIPAALFAICGFIFAILGIIFSALGRKSVVRGTMANIGLILSIVGLVLSIASSVYGIVHYAATPN